MGERQDGAFLDTAMPHLDMVHSLSRRLTRTREDAEDLVQEVMLKVFVAWRPHDPPRSMGAWLARICVNTAASGGRRRMVRPREHHDDSTIESWPDPAATEALALARVEATTVAAALATVSTGQREVVTLVNLCGFSTSEVARILGVPHGTVLSRLHRGHRALAVALAGQVTR